MSSGLPGTIWFVGGGVEAIPGIRRAKELGLQVVVSDGSPEAPGFRLADRGVVASTYDVDETCDAALAHTKNHGAVNGVLCMASDVPVTVAALAETLGLPGIPRASAVLATDKIAMKERLEANGVPIPWFRQVESPRHLKELVTQRRGPFVLKPADSRGARGVLRLEEATDLSWAFENSLSHSPTGRVLIERFLSGPQVSTESLVLDGVTYTPGMADRNYEHLERFAPYVIENGGELPCALPAKTRKEIRKLVARTAESLGIRSGVVKGDIVVHKGTPVVIELAARLSGGYLCSHHIPHSTGVDLVGLAIRSALGLPVDPKELAPRFQRGVAQRFLFPEPGRVQQISGFEEAACLPGVVHCELRVAVGDLIPELSSHTGRAGLVIATAPSREEAVSRAEAAAASIRIETGLLRV